MAGVRLEKLEKIFANGFKAVHGIDLDVKDGEFMVLVGPSGCAKSTTLRMVAGLETISGGRIFIGDQVVNDVEPRDRDIAMVFQIQMRVEIAKLHKQLKNTMIYVTHDQVKAMTLGDRICVMDQGRVKPVDAPANLYHHPDNTFVAGFIGSPAMNLVPATLGFEDRGCHAETAHMRLTLPEAVARQLKHFDEKEIFLGIRPEHIHSRMENRSATENCCQSDVLLVENMGSESYVYFSPGQHEYIARIDSALGVRAGDVHEM
jgi:multiple sugar transport system ATP-binding protein